MNAEGHPTIKPSLLTEIFGTPPTPNSRYTQEALKSTGGTQGTRNVKVEGIPTIKPSLLVDIFGTPPMSNSSGQIHDNESLKEDPYGNRPEQGVPTIKPSPTLFGTPNSSKQTHENTKIEDPQGTRFVETVPTIKPSLLVDVFGTPPTQNSSRQGYGGRDSKKDTQGTRNVNVEGLTTIDPSVLIDVFGTPTTEKSSRSRCGDVSSEGSNQFGGEHYF